MSESMRIGRFQRQSHGVAAALNMEPKRTTERNFVREHIRMIRLREREVQQEKQRLVDIENQPPVVSKKYAHVQARVYDSQNTSRRSSVQSSARVPLVGRNPSRYHSEYGKVPDYLTTQKQQKQEEADRKAA